MSGLAPLLAGRTPSGVYRWDHSARVSVVEHAAEHAGWRFVHLDCWPVEDRTEFSAAAGRAFGPAAGDDLEMSALDDVTPGPEQRGVLVLWEGWGALAEGDEPAFREVLGTFRKRADRGDFAVVLRGSGPELDIATLP